VRDLLFDHVQITVPQSLEAEVRHFYSDILGLPEIPKPKELHRRGGMWYQLGDCQLHVSLEDVDFKSNSASRRHVCYRVPDLEAALSALRECGVPIIPDEQPIQELTRFYLRDPGGNRLEIAQRWSSTT
jgi:catechol 2,3-dioxygenase-like lactoylglutathione lyase family enzyme